MARSVRTGTFGINGYAPDPLAPFGGYKESGIGREWGEAGLDEYVELKAINGLPGRDAAPSTPSGSTTRCPGLDEFLIHNHPHPVRVMWTSDLQAYERMWFTCQDTTGDLLVVAGMGIYPNLGTAEAFAIVNVRGRHTTVRAHRKLGLNRMDMSVGPAPLRAGRAVPPVEAAAGRERVRHRLRPLVVRHQATGLPAASGAGCSSGPSRSPGWPATTASVARAGGSPPTASGSSWTAAGYRGTRDHHWGTRDGVGGPALWSGNQHPHSGEWVEFEEYGVWGDHILYNLGDHRRGSDTLRGRRHRLRFEPDTHLLLSGEVDLVFADGEEKTMTFERLGNQIAFLRCGMYGGPNGGTPDGDIWHGMDVGDGVVTGETYDVNDPDVRARICGLDQHHARFECEGEVTYGIIEPYDTLCYEMASRPGRVLAARVRRRRGRG